jgi:hypothetical protein
MAYRRHPGSGPAEQQKKVNLAGNPAAQRCSEQEVFLLPADAVPNVGTKLGGREEDEGMNEPRAPRRVYIVGRGGRWHHPYGKPLAGHPTLAAASPRGNPRRLAGRPLAGLWA